MYSLWPLPISTLQVQHGQRVTVSYTIPAALAHALRDATGNLLERFSGLVVTNTVQFGPSLLSADVAADQLTLTYPSTLKTTQIPAAEDFAVSVGIVGRSVSTVDVSGSTVTLTLAKPVNAEERVTITYVVPDTNPLQYADGRFVPAFDVEEVRNTTKGRFQSAAVLGDKLGLNFDTELRVTGDAPAFAQFTVRVDGTRRNATAIARSGRTATLTLASAVAAGDLVTVSYAKPSENPLLTAAGSEVLSFTGRRVVNLTGRLPAIASVAITSTPALDANLDGTPDTYGAGETIDVDVEFDNAVEVIDDGSAGNVFVWLDMAPNNTLDLAADRRALPFHGLGRGGTIMRFRYTVRAADRDPDGVFVQPDPNDDTVVFLRGDAQVQAPGLSAAVADLTLAGLPFEGDPRHRVDGSEVGDRTPPEVTGATVDETALSVTFNETLDASSAPAGDAFTVSGGRTGTGTATVSGATATVTLDSAVLKGEMVTVSYVQPAGDPLQDAAGNAVASFSGRSVTNLTERERPVADAGADVDAAPGARVTLDGSASVDPNGDRLTFAWTQTAGGTVTLDGADRARLSFTAPATADALTFRLTVTDPDGLSDADDVTVHVSAPGQPLADAGGDVTAASGERVNLDGSRSRDPEGEALTFRWEQTAGATVVLSGADTPRLSFTAPAAADALTFRLRVTDPDGLSASDEVTVHVLAPGQPLADAGGDVTVAPGERVNLDGSRSRDPEGEALSFRWQQTAGATVVLSGADTPRLSFTAPAAADELTFRLRVTDPGGLSASDEVTVYVLAPGQPLADAGGDVTVAPGERVNLDGSRSRDPEGGSLSFHWEQAAGATVVLSGADTPRLSFTAPAGPAELRFLLRVADPDGLSASDEVTVYVLAPGQPLADAGGDLTVASGERVNLDGSGSRDPEGEALSFRWQQTDGNPVILSGTATPRLSFTAPAGPAELGFRLRVEDPDGLSASDEVRVFVSAPGTHAPVANAGPDLSAAPGEVITLDATRSSDADGDVLRYTWAQIGGGHVRLSGADRALLSFTAPSAPDVLVFRLTVRDATGLPNSDDVRVFVQVEDLHPTFGDAVVEPVVLTLDREMYPMQLPRATGGNGRLRYRMSSHPPGRAGLDFYPEARRLSGTPTMDGTFTFELRVSDEDGDEDVLAFAAAVRRPPTADAGEDFSADPGARVRLDGSASRDPEGDLLTLAWVQLGGTQVSLSDPAYAQPSFTAPAMPEVLAFRLTATDPDGLYASDEVRVTVRDQAPSFGDATVAALALREGEAMEPIILPEASGGNGALSYDLAAEPAGLAGLHFDAATRRLSGAPNAKGEWVFTYIAHDSDANRDDVAELSFAVTVRVSTRARKQILERTLAAVGSDALSSALAAIGPRIASTAPGTSASLGVPARKDDPDRPVPGDEAGWTDLLGSSAFSLALDELDEEGGRRRSTRWGVWGAGELSAFEARFEGGSRYAGDAQGGWLGFDARGARWVGGVAVSRSNTRTDYGFSGGEDAEERGRLETGLTTVYPYGRWVLGGGLEVVGLAGTGIGEARHRLGTGEQEWSELSMRVGSVGVRQALPSYAGFVVAVRGDYSFVSLETSAGEEAVDGLRADIRRTRMGLEIARPVSLGAAGAVEPFVGSSLRRDRGDGIGGHGFEYLAGVRYRASRVEIEARGRLLQVRTGEARAREEGASLTARVTSRPDGLGLSLSLSPRWGAGTGDAEALWRDEMPRLYGNDPLGRATLDADLGYGFALSSRGALTPFAAAAVTEYGRAAQFGTRYASWGSDLAVELAGECCRAGVGFLGRASVGW